MHRSLVSAMAVAVCAACGFNLPAHAAGLFDRPVGEQTLAEVRGGFSGPGGAIVVSFGVQQSVFVDGVLAATSALRPVAVGMSSPGDAPPLLLVQRGANNSIDAGLLAASAAGVVVQNSLDHQQLQTVTTLDVTANSLQAYRGLNLQASMRGAITDSLRR